LATENGRNAQIGKSHCSFYWNTLFSFMHIFHDYVHITFSICKYCNFKYSAESLLILTNSFIFLQENIFKQSVSYTFCIDVLWIIVWSWKLYKTRFYKCNHKNILLKRPFSNWFLCLKVGRFPKHSMQGITHSQTLELHH